MIGKKPYEQEPRGHGLRESPSETVTLSAGWIVSRSPPWVFNGFSRMKHERPRGHSCKRQYNNYKK